MLLSKFYYIIAKEMILGKSSPEIRGLSIYRSETIRRLHNGLNVTELSTLGKDGKVKKTRTVSFPDETSLCTSFTNVSNDIARIVTYINVKENVCISDVIFTEEDFKYDVYAWDKIIHRGIDNLAVLIRSLNDTCIDDIPMVMNAFPNIVETLFIKSGILMV
jgi:hypothetical protein